MNIDIRKSIINNFKNNSKNDIKEAIISSMNENDEITLPGLGVFFEILWKNSDEEHQDYILNIIERNLKGD
jgi:small, acid-soluble spore protein I